jgi:hypothetical protein
MYERYLNGETDLYDELMAKAREHLLQIMTIEPKAQAASFKLPAPEPKASLKTRRSVTVDTVLSILNTRKQLDSKMDECIKQSEVYRYEVQKGCSEKDAYKIALEFYTNLSRCVN